MEVCEQHRGDRRKCGSAELVFDGEAGTCQIKKRFGTVPHERMYAAREERRNAQGTEQERRARPEHNPVGRADPTCRSRSRDCAMGEPMAERTWTSASPTAWAGSASGLASRRSSPRAASRG